MNERAPGRINSKFLTTISRGFLGLGVVSVGAALSTPPIIVGLNPESRSGIMAAASRPSPEASKLPNLEILYPSDETLKATWEEHFIGRENIMNYEAWSYRHQETNWQGIGRSLSVFASLSYPKDKRSGESFDDYYKRYLNQLHKFSNDVQLDFIVLTASLAISSRNLHDDNYKSLKETTTLDKRVSDIQSAILAPARALGAEEILLNGMRQDGLPTLIIDRLYKKMDEDAMKNQQPLPKRFNVIPAFGVGSIYNLIRFRTEPTVGMMDYEPQQRAMAFADPVNAGLKSEFSGKYPTVANKYTQIQFAKSRVEAQRGLLEQEIEMYLKKYPKSLEPFAKASPTALEAIGLGKNLDIWQLTNYTQAFYETTQTPYDSAATWNRISLSMQGAAKFDQPGFYLRFMSQQINNPKFLDYLTNQAQKTGSSSEVAQIQILKQKTNTFNQKAKELRTVLNETLIIEGPKEYDDQFQQMTSVMITNMLAKEIGAYEPANKSSVAWMIYQLVTIREISSPFLLVNGSRLVQDVTIDNPYARHDMRVQLNELAVLLQQNGMISRPPQEDIVPFVHTIYRMLFESDDEKILSQWPNLSREKWAVIKSHFRTYLASEYIIDPQRRAQYPPITHAQSVMSQLLVTEMS